MAIEFARINFITRGKGHSVVAAMAYRAGTKAYDERIGKTFDYENKPGVLYGEVLLPEGASDEFKNPKVLWNKVERCEKRINSQLARELILALPADKEITDEDRVELARRFTQKHFVDKGLAAQICIHAPDRGNKNFHAHIMVTTRRLYGKEFAKYKARDLHPEVKCGQVIVEGKIWKDYWREEQNHFFKERGLDLEVDPSGVISQIHLGKDAFHSKDRAYNEKHQENERRKEKARKIALTKPHTLLDVLTQRHAVFSEVDIAMTVLKHTHNIDEYNEAMARVKACKSLVELGEDEQTRKVLYTTKPMMKLEQKMLKGAVKLSKRNHHKVSQRFTQKTIKKKGLNVEQARAIEHVVHGKDIALVVGKAGTGKSYSLGAAKEIWEHKGYNVIGLCLAKTAAKNLEEGSGIKSQTLDSLLFRIKQGSLSITNKDVLVLDEAGMVDNQKFAELVSCATKAGAKLVCVGDPRQLNPIGPGAPFRALSEQLGHAQMDNIRRQKVEWQNKATHDLARHKIKEGIAAYDKRCCVVLTDTSCSAKNQIADTWMNDFNAKKTPATILAFKNAEVDELNGAIRDRLKLQDKLSNESPFKTHTGEKHFAAGDEVIFLKNEKQLDVSNGQKGRVVKAKTNTLTIKTHDTQKEIKISAKQYNQVNHAYAVGVYKAQGLTVDKSLVYVGDYGWNKNMTYVAMSRHKESMQIFASREHYADKDKLIKALSKDSIKYSVMDFPIAFAQRRGIEPKKLIEQAKEKFKAFANRNMATAKRVKSQLLGQKSPFDPEYTVQCYMKAKSAKRHELASQIMKHEKECFEHVKAAELNWSEIEFESHRHEQAFKKQLEAQKEKVCEKQKEHEYEH